eukprot:COSAG01_NODE_5238_length_4370_cov_4.514678_3_plen_77_part_00
MTDTQRRKSACCTIRIGLRSDSYSCTYSNTFTLRYGPFFAHWLLNAERSALALPLPQLTSDRVRSSSSYEQGSVDT